MLASTSHQLSATVCARARLAELSLPGVRIGVAPEPVRRLLSGWEDIDVVLGGGVPCGRISEVVGPSSCGKTSLVTTLLASITRRGEMVAWVDLPDALYPASLAAAGVDLQRVVWVRPPAVADAFRCAELLLQAAGLALIVFDIGPILPRVRSSHVWPRLLRAAVQSHTALVILSPHRIAGSFAVLSLQLRPRSVRWRPGLWQLFEGFESAAVLVRNKLGVPQRHATVVVGQTATGSRKQKAESRKPESSGFSLSAFSF